MILLSGSLGHTSDAVSSRSKPKKPRLKISKVPKTQCEKDFKTYGCEKLIKTYQDVPRKYFLNCAETSGQVKLACATAIKDNIVVNTAAGAATYVGVKGLSLIGVTTTAAVTTAGGTAVAGYGLYKVMQLIHSVDKACKKSNKHALEAAWRIFASYHDERLADNYRRAYLCPEFLRRARKKSSSVLNQINKKKREQEKYEKYKVRTEYSESNLRQKKYLDTRFPKRRRVLSDNEKRFIEALDEIQRDGLEVKDRQSNKVKENQGLLDQISKMRKTYRCSSNLYLAEVICGATSELVFLGFGGLGASISKPVVTSIAKKVVSKSRLAKLPKELPEKELIKKTGDSTPGDELIRARKKQLGLSGTKSGEMIKIDENTPKNVFTEKLKDLKSKYGVKFIDITSGGGKTLERDINGNPIVQISRDMIMEPRKALRELERVSIELATGKSLARQGLKITRSMELVADPKAKTRIAKILRKLKQHYEVKISSSKADFKDFDASGFARGSSYLAIHPDLLVPGREQELLGILQHEIRHIRTSRAIDAIRIASERAIRANGATKQDINRLAQGIQFKGARSRGIHQVYHEHFSADEVQARITQAAMYRSQGRSDKNQETLKDAYSFVKAQRVWLKQALKNGETSITGTNARITVRHRGVTTELILDISPWRDLNPDGIRQGADSIIRQRLIQLDQHERHIRKKLKEK